VAPQREWFEKDYYRALGVSESATDKDIGKAYRKLAKQYHPDANPGSEDRFKEISAAYDVLGDEAKRKEYDEVRRMGPAANPFATPGNRPRSGAPGASAGFGADDLSDLIGNIFNRGSGRASRPRPGARAPQQGADLETSLHLSFLDAINGVTTTVNVTSDVTCHTCNGTGAAPGASPNLCSVCSGRGVVNDDQGLFGFSQPCPNCAGRGFTIDKPCPTCHGAGTERKDRHIKVRIPAGVEDGQRIRIKGRGGPGRDGGGPGDLFIVVHTDSHALFGRRGARDLTLSVPVSFAEAALGTTITVPTLDNPVTLRIPAGTPSGRTFRVRSHGVPATSGRGDLLVTVEVAVPSKLTDAEREAVSALSDVLPGDGLRAGLGVTGNGAKAGGSATSGGSTAGSDASTGAATGSGGGGGA
jgi:molecular chaperone DnaJ